MANPKYIPQALRYKTKDHEKEDEKVNKEPYSFRCDERLLDAMKKYAELDGIGLPELLSNIMANFIKGKTLTNTFLTDYEGMYINIESNAGHQEDHEYEIRYIVNNLDEWSSDYGYVSTQGLSNGILHEGIDFLVIPETVHTKDKLSELEAATLHREYDVQLDRIPSCLYCMYMTVDKAGRVEIDKISWTSAMNKLKAAGRYDMISHGNKIKKELDTLHQTYIYDSESGMYDDSIEYTLYGRLLKIAEKYNTGAILPASISIDNIEYAPIVENLPDNYDLINKIMKENDKYKKVAAEVDDVLKRLDELEQQRDKSSDEIPDDHVD